MSCIKFPTKEKVFAENNIVSNIERFVSERRSFPNEADSDGLTILEYEGILIWDSIWEQYEIMCKQSLMQIGGMFGK